jgi:hypothetical protein
MAVSLAPLFCKALCHNINIYNKDLRNCRHKMLFKYVRYDTAKFIGLGVTGKHGASSGPGGSIRGTFGHES